MKNFPHYHQSGQMDCGPTCLRMISKFHGKSISSRVFYRLAETSKVGTSLNSMSMASERIGFKTMIVSIDIKKLEDSAPLPCVIHWNQNHYVVLYKIKNNKYYVSDPAHGKLIYKKKEFLKFWTGSEEADAKGIVLLIVPTPKFNSSNFDENEVEKQNFSLSYIFHYMKQYKKFIVQLMVGVIVASMLQLLLPFLTQSIVDIGIKNQDFSLIVLLLIAQIFLFIGKVSIEIIRNWILLHLSTRISISLISDFFMKLMGLPIAFFDNTQTGEVFQRIQDHKRLENLITSSTLNVIFSVLTILILGLVLATYNTFIFGVFIAGSILYFLWIAVFLKKRRDLDYKKFTQVSRDHSRTLELINGMQEIKLNNAERYMRWGWESVQTKLFRLGIKSLSLEQKQTIGSSFINEIKNIFMIFLAAQAVIQGSMTLGMMLAISYIIGQLNGPILQLVNFMHALQDARISIDRLDEIHAMEDEEDISKEQVYKLPAGLGLSINNVFFKYPGAKSTVLNGITFSIQNNTTTAIVGASGSGKTTLMKMLLGFYRPDDGNVNIGHFNIDNISPVEWRNQCGIVMQEGHIFNETIAGNIALGAEHIDTEVLYKSASIANILEFVEKLPLGFDTKIGGEGLGLSTGQKQRILIARAIYKNPKFLFFDEATSSLDATNESEIMVKLGEYLKSKTAIIIAHRLSTVRNADQIIVMKNGLIEEIGTHQYLLKKEGSYYNLVKDQLELEKLHKESLNSQMSVHKNGTVKILK